jgi:phosphate transport system protein
MAVGEGGIDPIEVRMAQLFALVSEALAGATEALLSNDVSTALKVVGVLLIVPELERSGDLAEHIAQRAASNLGSDMSPLSRGIVQRMAEVALEMWRAAADAYGERAADAASLSEDDEEIDILHDRLTGEVAAGTMPTPIGAQVTLLARFYERIGDHAVNLARRIEMLHGAA